MKVSRMGPPLWFLNYFHEQSSNYVRFKAGKTHLLLFNSVQGKYLNISKKQNPSDKMISCL